YNTEDIIQEIVRKNDLSIFNIQISNFSEMYATKYFSRELDTFPYYIGEENLNSITNVLREIFYSQFYYYQMTIDEVDLETYRDCSKIEMKVNNLNFPTAVIDNNIKNAPSVNRYKSLALFDYKSSNEKSEYNSLIDSLAKTLVANSIQTLEIVGNSGIEGSND